MLNLRILWMPVLLLIFVLACGAATTAAPPTSAVLAAQSVTPSPTDSPVASASPTPKQQETATRTPQSPQATLSAITHAPPQSISPELREVTLTAAEIRRLVHLGIRSAMADLAQRFEKPLDGVRILAARQATWPDASLGCPKPSFSYAQVLTEGIQLLLLYQR